MAMADIDQQQPSARLEYAHDFDQRTLPLVASCDVMQCPAGDHDIEAAGIERQVARIGCTDLDALTDAFQPHVAQRRLRAVTRLILTAPDRSEERRVGKECVSTCRSRWSPYPVKKQHNVCLTLSSLQNLHYKLQLDI